MLDAVDRVAFCRVCMFLFCATLLTGCQGMTTQRNFIDDKSPAELAATVPPTP